MSHHPVRGRVLGVDVGKVRVGVALSDPDRILATPLETVQRDPRADTDPPGDVARIAALSREHEVVEIVVGLPVTLSGEESFAAVDARAYADRLRPAVEVPIRFVDERLTTAVASRRLSERGVKGKRRKAVVDQAAAVEILQSWLEKHRKA